MKFATLALALLLAVGSQAAPMQADAPQMMAHVRSVADMYLENLRASLITALNQMEDADMKNKAVQHVQSAFEKVAATRENLAPVTDNVLSTIMEATSDFRTTIENDIQALKAEIQPMEEVLKTTVNKHLDEYKEKFGPIIAEYQVRHNEEMAALRAKMEPIVEEMQGRLVANVEETKNALMPILDAVSRKVRGWVSNARNAAVPYVVEYKDQAQQFISNVRSITPEEITALREKLIPLAQETNERLQAMLGAVSEVIMKS